MITNFDWDLVLLILLWGLVLVILLDVLRRRLANIKILGSSLFMFANSITKKTIPMTVAIGLSIYTIYYCYQNFLPLQIENIISIVSTLLESIALFLICIILILLSTMNNKICNNGCMFTSCGAFSWDNICSIELYDNYIVVFYRSKLLLFSFNHNFKVKCSTNEVLQVKALLEGTLQQKVHYINKMNQNN